MAGGPGSVGAVKVVGLTEFKQAMKDADGNWDKELKKANKKVAQDIVVPPTRSRLASFSIRNMNGNNNHLQYERLAGSVKAAATNLNSRVDIGNVTKQPYLWGALMGSKRHSQFPAWVGSDWQPGEPGGPYGIGAVVAERVDEIVEVYGVMLDELYRKAFPE